MLRPTVAVFARPSGLSVRLVEALLSNFCFVKVLSEEKDSWEEALSSIQQKNLFKIVNQKKERGSATFEYLVLLNENLSFGEKEVLDVCRWGAACSAKILVVLPYVTEGARNWQQREDIRAAVLEKIPEAAVLFVGDVYGPPLFFETAGPLMLVLRKVVSGEKVEDYGETFFYPVFYEQVAKYLVRSVFSFGPYGKETALYSQKITAGEFLTILGVLMQGEISIRRKALERKEALGIRKEILGGNLGKNLKIVLENPSARRTAMFKPKTRAYFIKKGVVVGFFVLAVIPFLLMAIGAASLPFSLKKQRFSDFSAFTTKNASAFFQVYGRIPFFGLLYRPFIPSSKVLALFSEVGQAGIRVLGQGRVLAGFILGDEVYDPTPLAEAFSAELGDIYTKTGLLEGEIQNLRGLSAKSVLRLIPEEKINEVRKKVLSAKALAEALPDLLGKESPKTYLILFQNNMELRPTGGFIGSFALVSFDAGRLVDINTFDVYAADGGLKGHVEPPAAIKKYLGEANWFLRDSNWDPDFPTSAARAEWFLDKEVDKQVDGVVAVDLEVVKGILRATGPVVLADFNQVFDYKNLYEVLQKEVESGFFPGSQKKASVMTGLTREIVKRFSQLDEAKYPPLAKELLTALEERHMQIYLNPKEPQVAISLLGYSGEVLRPTCGGNCFSDWYGAIDANVGVTKANYFINRSFDLKTVISNNIAKKQLTITYENTANPALGQTARYRTFTRILAPEASVFEKVKIENAGAYVETDLEEKGVAVEISPGQTKKLIFSWEIPIQRTQPGGVEYRLYVRKQAGTLKDPLSISILTNDGAYNYNTNLARDFFARIFFE